MIRGDDMKNMAKFGVLLSMLLMLNGCSKIGSEVLSQETIGNSNTIETTQVTETIGISNRDIVDITPYIDTLSNDEINDNLLMYLDDIYYYNAVANYDEVDICDYVLDFAEFTIKRLNKKYPLDLSTNYPRGGED